ncbi:MULTISPECIES: DsrE/DsrF/DrsH-like family protein [Clostridium]|uniref:DsrE/DsrF/DrsH-like family protein n=1 Tax=Clostridium TaxID=1485 RepID=UPI000827073D|nr:MULTISPECIES: DsrE/DsrF/DrsH-like family protein [Clostridium]PJI07975.1 pyridine nucleotide-disulfide oxidoreductase [Clostridium sp. CT7]
MKKVVIVGGVAGGASAAARLRRLDEEVQIVMLEKDSYISFANCGLPYHIGETIKDRDRLIVQTPSSMKERFNIDVRINSEVISVDTKNKVIEVNSKDKGIYKESYDNLILSPGARAFKPPIEGIDSDKILTLRNIPDMDRIKSLVDSGNVKDAVVIGGGYVGVEMAENLKDRGLNVTLVEAAPHILAPFDTDMSVIVEKELYDNGVDLVLNDGVKAFEDNGDYVEISLASGNKLKSQLVILSIGVVPETSFLKNTGIELGKKGHIIVNDNMETNIEGVFAVGDAVEVVDFVNKNKTAIALAGPANKQGRIAADNICGIKSIFKGSEGTAIIKVFNVTAASTGNNERTLKRLGIPYKVVVVHPASHASYYPDSHPVSIKLIFGDDGKIFGAQAVGYDGVDKRIDVIASTIRLNGTVYDLTELELSYAPPYSSAKDPVNMAGFAAENVLTGKAEVITAEEFLDMNREDTLVIDVRTKIEYENGNVAGAVNIPVDSLRDRIDEIDKDKEIIVYCQVGLRGYIAQRILKQKGFKVKNLTGGYKSLSVLSFKPEVANRNDNNDAQKEAAVDIDKKYDKALDACGLCCPGPLMQVKACVDSIEIGKILKVTASDPGFYEDIKAWCKRTNNGLLDLKKDGGTITAFIKKGSGIVVSENLNSIEDSKDNKTMVVFSGDLDKAIASFIIANGAASMGKKVTMFFTFWGLSILRKPEKADIKKGLVEKMFGMMLPRGSEKLKLSKMNMMGMGTKMIRKVMKDKNVSSLEELIKAAIDSGIQIVACQMSMDIMGIKKEELIDGVKIGGVGYYLGEAEDSNVNLFI